MAENHVPVLAHEDSAAHDGPDLLQEGQRQEVEERETSSFTIHTYIPSYIENTVFNLQAFVENGISYR